MRNLPYELHSLFNKQKRFAYPFENQMTEMPDNGVYVKFEKGERFDGLDRIVRVGTDTGENNLKKRLLEHFVTENKNRSIFRKNIGRAFLNKERNPYLKVWELDTTSKVEKANNLKFIDKELERVLERKISAYIKGSFSFCVFRVETKESRLFWESKIVSTLAQSKIQASDNWLGNHSPKKPIRESGLWQVQGLKDPKLTDEEFEELQKMIG